MKSQAEKDAARLEVLRLEPRGDWTKAKWKEFGELQEKLAAQMPEPTFPDEEKTAAAPEEVKVAEKKFRKLEPPKQKFDGSGDFETFRRQVMIWWGFTTRGETASFVCTIMGPWTWLKKRVTTTYRVIGERNAFASSTLVVEGWR